MVLMDMREGVLELELCSEELGVGDVIDIRAQGAASSSGASCAFGGFCFGFLPGITTFSLRSLLICSRLD